jgi:hypothetical protein
MRPRAASLLLAGLALLVAPGGLLSQGTATASFGATAVIDNTAVTIGQLNGLDFGVVVPGTPTTIGPKTALAGKFVVHGSKNAEVRITFALPTLLTVGPNSMPISFADDPVAGKLGCHRNQDQQNTCTTYTPSTSLLVRIRNNPPPQNTFFVWIGGKVSPVVGQQPGTYTGLVTMSAVYTGN